MISEKYNHQKFYNEWVLIIKENFPHAVNYSKEMYSCKDNLDNQLSTIFVSKLETFYSHFRHLYDIYIGSYSNLTTVQQEHNKQNIEKRVLELAEKHSDLFYFIGTARDLTNSDMDLGLTDEFLFLGEEFDKYF